MFQQAAVLVASRIEGSKILGGAPLRIGRKFGLAIAASALMVTAAHASTVVYNVNFQLPATDRLNQPVGGDVAVTGTITTDGKLGVLNLYDITSSSLEFAGEKLTLINVNGDSLSANSKGELIFSFGIQPTVGTVDFSSSSRNAFLYLVSSRDSTQDFIYGAHLYVPVETRGFEHVPVGTEFTLGTNSVSSVPLPASAPMFGAAILAMGMIGYGVKRKKAASAA